MPPKAKFSKEEIIDAAFKITCRDGFDALTARSLAAELGSSPRPIFTVFNGMEEVQNEVKAAATKLYEQYEDEEMSGEKAFKGSGTGYIRFAAEQPKLFQLLFMKERENVPNLDSILSVIDNYYYKILGTVESEYGFTTETAKRIYLHMWLYSHGIASLIATKVCNFTQDDISEMLNDVGAGIIRKYKAEGRK
ncbi:MAG: TetR/AcrR family transcriptional regulator [Clostridia bacterium]|nr:TetR/AcrR family transcriptional regulator [Clostridia bacterium]